MTSYYRKLLQQMTLSKKNKNRWVVWLSADVHASWGTDVRAVEKGVCIIRMDGQTQRIQLVSTDSSMALGHRIQVM